MNNHSISESLKACGDAAMKAADAIRHISAMLRPLQDAFGIITSQLEAYPNRRSLYLAMHGSPRVREKNRKRYSQWLLKEGHKYTPKNT